MNDNAFNLVIGVLALASTIASLLRYFKACLPIKQIESFDKILQSSKMLFIKAGKNGFVTESLHAEISMRFERLDVSSLEARARAYESSRGLGICMLRSGLLKEIGLLIEAAEDLRLFVVISAQRQQQLRRDDRISSRPRASPRPATPRRVPIQVIHISHIQEPVHYLDLPHATLPQFRPTEDQPRPPAQAHTFRSGDAGTRDRERRTLVLGWYG